MQKLLIISIFLTLISCKYLDKNVALDFNLDDRKSNIGNGARIDLVVSDNRLEKQLFGTKEYCNNKKIHITTNQNLAELLKKKIGENLSQKCFRNGKDRLVEVSIEQLKYKAQCNFIIGTSQGDIELKVAITDPKTGVRISKSFELSLTGKHFFVPLEATDEKIINNLFEEVVFDMLNNEALLRNFQ